MANCGTTISAAADLEGSSLVAPDADNIVLAESMSDAIQHPVLMVRQKKFKLIAGKGQPDMLFDMENDPDEINNLAATRPKIVGDLKQVIEQNWDTEQLQRDIDQSVSNRLLIHQSHCNGVAPVWDYLPDHPDNAKWCRTGTDYTDWSTNVSNPR